VRQSAAGGRGGVDATPEPYWHPVSTPRVLTASVLFALLALALLVNRSGFLPLLDHANLAFHEAGHLVYGIFGRTAALYGGTLGQLTFPTLTALSFLWRRDAVATALCGAWFFENLFNIARYAADARARSLPLVGGGEHDWFNILARWGALHADARVASTFRLIGWLGLATLWAWLGWRWWRDRSRADA
jgi:hypothetical protein